MFVQMFTLQVESEDRPSPGDRRPVPSLQPPTEGTIKYRLRNDCRYGFLREGES